MIILNIYVCNSHSKLKVIIINLCCNDSNSPLLAFCFQRCSVWYIGLIVNIFKLFSSIWPLTSLLGRQKLCCHNWVACLQTLSQFVKLQAKILVLSRQSRFARAQCPLTQYSLSCPNLVCLEVKTLKINTLAWNLMFKMSKQSNRWNNTLREHVTTT